MVPRFFYVAVILEGSHDKMSLLPFFLGINMAKDKVAVAKGVTVSRGKEEKMREKKGSSNVGKYKTVKPKDFAGSSGGASKYSFPINTLARGRNALARAHFAPNPAGIKSAVYKKYPGLKKKKKMRERAHII